MQRINTKLSSEDAERTTPLLCLHISQCNVKNCNNNNTHTPSSSFFFYPLVVSLKSPSNHIHSYQSTYMYIQYTQDMYSIPRAECPCMCIGQTGRSLDHCLREQHNAWRLAASALAKHMFSSDHQVGLSKAMVTDTCTHTLTRCLLESWYIIQHQQAPLNSDRGTLLGLYTTLLDWPCHLLVFYSLLLPVNQFVSVSASVSED